jgi:hypothetical protein
MSLDGIRRQDRLLVEYEGDSHLHERRVLAVLDEQRLVVVTPHWDCYEESISDFSAVYRPGPRGGLPRKFCNGVHRGRVVLFRPAEMEARWPALLSDWVDRCPSPRPGGRELPVVDAVVAVAAGAPSTHGETPRGVTHIVDSRIWLAMETTKRYVTGEAVAVDAWKLHVVGNRGILECPEGPLAVALLDSWSLPAQPPALDDLRTQPVKYDGFGSRTQPYGTAVLGLSETAFSEWRVSGPRTCRWLCKAIVDQDSTPTRRHHWWRSALSLSVNDEGVEEHAFISEVLETALCFDALNVSELACFEQMARRYQLWEHFYGDALKVADQRSSGHQALEGEERGIFLGQERSRALALICPSLELHVSEQLRNRASILKERRKAREERVLVAQPPIAGQPDGKNKKGRGRGG